MTKKQKVLNIKLFLAIGLAATGFLVCITIFVITYNDLRSGKGPAASIMSQETGAQKQAVNFIAVGDIMLSRNVAHHAEKSGSTVWMWEHIHDFLKQSDFVFGNLEGPTNGTNIYSYDTTLSFNALPKLISTLGTVGFSIVNLANNHILDQ